MNILYISAFPPNRKTAGQNYSRQLIDDLCDSNNVTLFYFSYNDHLVEVEGVDEVRRYETSPFLKIRNFFLFFFLFPFFTNRFSFRLLFDIKKIAKAYDLIYFDFSQVFIYSLFIKHHNKVLMSHDVIFQMFNRKIVVLKYLILSFVRFTESLVLHSANKVYCFSNKDQELFSTLYNVKSYSVSFYIDPLLSEIDFDKLVIDDYFVLYGAWNRKENASGLVWFLDNVYSKISNQIQLIILGGGMSDSLKYKLKQFPKIQNVGFVKNPYVIICKSKALIAPLFSGAGVKVKVIESLATGTPVIGTGLAFEGIASFKVNDSSPMICVNSPDEYIQKILEHKIDLMTKNDIRKYFINNYFNQKFINLYNHK